MRMTARWGLGAALALAVAACGGGSHPAASAATTSSSPPAPSSSAPAISAAALAARILPVPRGFTLATKPAAPIGPLSPAAFNTLAGAGSSVTLGFVDGQSTTFDSATTGDSAEVDLLQFAASTGAISFVTGTADALASDTSQAPVKGTDPAIAGSVTVSATKEDATHTAEYDVVARQGDLVMIVQYATDLGAAHQAAAFALALAQYDRL
jgi:hypothetical protein